MPAHQRIFTFFSHWKEKYLQHTDAINAHDCNVLTRGDDFPTEGLFAAKFFRSALQRLYNQWNVTDSADEALLGFLASCTRQVVVSSSSDQKSDVSSRDVD